MKTVITALLASAALACSAQTTLPPAPEATAINMRNAGAYIEKAGFSRQVGVSCMLGAAVIGGLTAINVGNGNYASGQETFGYAAAGALFTAGITFNIIGNSHEIHAGRILQMGSGY